jgi:hypothetical protein
MADMKITDISRLTPRVVWRLHDTPAVMGVAALLRVSVAMGGTNTPKGHVRSSRSHVCPNGWEEMWIDPSKGVPNVKLLYCPLCTDALQVKA